MKTRITLLLCIVLASALLTACGQTAAVPEEIATATETEAATKTEIATETTTATETETATETTTGTGSQSAPTSTGLMGSFSAKDTEGNSIDQSIFAAYDLTMVNVWATYCGPCLSEMPELGELSREYESKGVRIVGMVSDVLNSDGSVSASQLDTVHSIIAETGADYLHIVPSEDLYGLLSQITAVPTTFFVDSTGTQVGSAYLGSRSKAEWTDIIAQTLAEAQK